MANEASETPAAGSADRAAAVRGALLDRPVPRLLHELFRKQITGYLQIVDDSGDESRLYLRDGAPVHIERPNDIDRLDQVLIEAGLMSPEVIRGFSATLPPGKRLGETLIERGLITARALGDVLKLQVRRKLMRMFFPRKGEFSVYVEAHPYGTGGEYGEMRIDPRCLIYPGIRAAYDEHRLEAELAALKNHNFRLLPTLSSSLLEAMGFPAHDPTLRALSERTLSLADLPVAEAKRIDSLSVVIALLYTDLLETAPLVGTRAVETAAPRPSVAPVAYTPPVSPPPPASRGAVRPPDSDRHRTTGTYPVVSLGAGPSARPSPPTVGGRPFSGAGRTPSGQFPMAQPGAAAESSRTPPGTAAVQGNLAAQISELHGKIETLSHFQLLGVPETAPLAEVGAAYLKKVRLFHPDRLPSLGLGHLTDKAARIVAQLNEAQSVLGDAKRRSEYVAARARPSQTAIVDSGQSILAAERCFQMGEVQLRKGDHVRAVESFVEAMRANPLEPNYKAYWAWARWDSPGPHKDRLVRETLKLIEDSMKERPRFPQGLYWIGLLHKHLGDLASAATAFKAAIGQDANLLDAERELRVIELRRTKASAAHASMAEKPGAASAARQKPGVLNKILKR